MLGYRGINWWVHRKLNPNRQIKSLTVCQLTYEPIRFSEDFTIWLPIRSNHRDLNSDLLPLNWEACYHYHYVCLLLGHRLE